MVRAKYVRGLALSLWVSAAFVPPLPGSQVMAANIGIGADARIQAPLKSMKDLRDRNLVRQRFDYSCGAAALATILRYGFGEEVTEREILSQLFDLLSEEEKDVSRKEGFSLLDLQQVAQSRGYNAQGFRLSAENLPKLRGPVIVAGFSNQVQHLRFSMKASAGVL